MPRKKLNRHPSHVAIPGYKRVPHKFLPFDPVFFRKVDVFRGQKLLSMARLTPNTHWEVKRIVTDLGLGRGVKRVDVVEHLSDMVELRCVEHPELWRTCSFQTLSYGAHWRLPDTYRPPRLAVVD